MNARWLRMLALLFAGGLFVQGVAVCQGQPIRPEFETFVDVKAEAEKGVAWAQNMLGLWYETGTDVEKNDAEAAKWYRKAAEQGVVEAQFRLGLMYSTGRGVGRDHAEAVKWYRKATEKGFTEAQFNLGLMYANGEGVKKDDAEAVKWYRKAAEQNHALAQFLLGCCYSDGEGVQQDDTEAAEWWRKAAEQNVAPAQRLLGDCYVFGKGVPKDGAEAVKWLRKSAEQKNAEAQAQLGSCFADGFGVPKDYAEAVKWWRMAAEQGAATAQFNVGLYCLNGAGVPKDDVEAVRWFRRAAEQNVAEAQAALGRCYLAGRGVPKDYAEGYKWLILAAAQGNEDARKGVELFEKYRMTREQIAEGQRLAREFKPRQEAETKRLSSANDIAASRPGSTGTGFFISEDGYLVTNQHVVKEGSQVRVLTAGGLLSARVLKVDTGNDLAILKAEGKFAALPVASSRAVKLGATAATVGFPNVGLQGFSPKLTKGEIGSLAGAQDDPRHFQISAAIQPGNSGGALVDERGNVIGVVVAKLSQKAALATSGTLAENVNYAVKSSFLLGFLESLPDVAAKLKEPNIRERKFEDVVKDVERATVLVLVY